ncbi:FkbM family methyltransferase [Duganella sp. FT109W]|uniref:FkbM family methyltransferase n=1 Tax=Duganella margarita TaxID=2692170 RepID=A0ABW9WF47_9BURK|nr:FkbM family methyltransferase [Duganella margarita]MYN39727.1 FkbM family methyltransferase [Duganella margarita]
MNFVSYAPNFEDVMLWRALRHVAHGFYVDVGAGAPVLGSVTQAFYQRGWRGINLEPARALQERLSAARPADVTLALLAGSTDGEALFYDSGASQRSSTDAEQARACRTDGLEVMQRPVRQTTLDAICEEHAEGAIHFVNLAVNGAEAEVLAGFELARWQPWIVLVRQHPDDAAIAAAMQAARYTLAYQDGDKCYYVSPQQAALAAVLALPPHAGDQFVLAEDHHYTMPLTAWRERAAAGLAAERAAQDWVAAHERGLLERAEHLQQQLTQAQLDRQHTEQALAQARLDQEQALAQLTGELQAANQRTAEQSARADHNDARAEAHAADAAHQVTRVDALAVQMEWQVAHTRRLQGELDAIYHSVAWRLARPIRGAVKAVKYLRHQLRHRLWQCRDLAARARRRSRQSLTAVAKGVARRAMRFIQRRPALDHFLRRQLGRSPRMVRLLRTIAMRSTQAPADQAGAAPMLPADTQPDHLPPATRQVYDQLLQAVQRARNP